MAEVERQHVHVHRLKLQQQRLNDGDVGVLEEIEHAHFLAVEWIGKAVCDIGDLSEIDGEQEYVRHIDLPGPLEHAGAGDDEAVLAHGAAIDEGRSIAGNEDEDLGRIAEAVIADGDPAHCIGRNVVEKDQPESDTAKQVKPKIAFG